MLPIYNAEKYLCQAIDSILCQSFTNFEIVAINDGSSDSSLRILQDYCKKDSRVIVLTNEHNIGLQRTLNKAICIANGEFIARMDADDISYRKRFEKQVEFLNENQSVFAVGTSVKLFGSTISKTIYAPASFLEVRLRAIFETPLMHPTVMFRRDLFLNKKLKYSEKNCSTEDYALWVEMMKFGELRNINLPMLKYRVLPNSISSLARRKNAERRANEHRTIFRDVMAIWNYVPSHYELDTHVEMFCDSEIPKKEIKEYVTWHKKLQQLTCRYIDPSDFKFVQKEFAWQWYRFVSKVIRYNRSRGFSCLSMGEKEWRNNISPFRILLLLLRSVCRFI